MTTTNRARVVWVDYARGFGIFLVVLGHALRGLRSSHIIIDNPAWFRYVDAWIYSFHMPLFFLLSGLFAERQIKRTPVAFVQEKLATIAYPYVLWSILQTLVQFTVSGQTNHPPDPHALLWIFVDPIMQFWFLYALFLISLTYFALRRWGFSPLLGLAAFAAFWLSREWIPLVPWGPLIATRNNGVFYALGAVLDQRAVTERVERAPWTALVATMLVGYGIVSVSAAALGENVFVALAVTICGISASIALAALLSRARGLDLVRVMGFYSLEIYVAHTIASAGARIGLQKALKVNDVTTHVVVGTLCGIALPLILGLACRRYHAEFLFRFPLRPSKPHSQPTA